MICYHFLACLSFLVVHGVKCKIHIHDYSAILELFQCLCICPAPIFRVFGVFTVFSNYLEDGVYHPLSSAVSVAAFSCIMNFCC